MPVVCLNTSAYSPTDPPDMTTSSSPYNASAYEDGTPTAAGISDPGDPLVYILAVLSFYVLSITLLMAKSIHKGRDEKNYDDYIHNFIKREGGRNNGYTPSAFAKSAKLPPPPPQKSEATAVEITTSATGQPAKTALKKPHGGTRPKTKETVRLIEPSEVERIKALSKKDKRKKHSKRNLEPVLMTSV